MTERRLTEATVPMCPKCGGELVPSTGSYRCDNCYPNGVRWVGKPLLGYYAVGVAEVVDMLNEMRKTQPNRSDIKYAHLALRDFMRIEEGKR